ncbi:Alpha/Beta hydrolase protein [Trichoderma longibrachiatum]|uniref:Alpha/beta-hydrolase n=1 Tax=Trichoderma longibrachiatum ATCC 18648 TaxID=983965 RepID=A0A2T4CK46_TRILO|nr:alpha/beta-hydrolase [Trichoderma longibrachiatum ATCC 18648]
MSADEFYDAVKGDEEHLLQLPGGRQIAYAHNGPPTSRTVIIFFVGIMGVGTAANVPEPCREIRAHWIAPTLPGMGRSSTRDRSVPYHVNLANDISALLNHLYPTGEFDALYVSGGSYGTVPAQMLYGAPYDLFPHGRKIAGMLLLNGFSPLRLHAGYAKKLSWNNWFSIGPPTRIIPFRLLQRMFKAAIGSKLKSVQGATQFLKATVFNTMDDEEKRIFKDWLQKNRFDEDTVIEKMAWSTVRCCQNWDGFMEVSDTIHSDWGFDPRTLDEEHSSKPVLIVGSKNDHIGGSTNDWLVASYKSARELKLLSGGHISSLFFMDELWRDIIEASQSA